MKSGMTDKNKILTKNLMWSGVAGVVLLIETQVANYLETQAHGQENLWTMICPRVIGFTIGVFFWTLTSLLPPRYHGLMIILRVIIVGAVLVSLVGFPPV